MATRDFGSDVALMGCAVGEHWIARDVANGKDVVDICAACRVDVDNTAFVNLYTGICRCYLWPVRPSSH